MFMYGFEQEIFKKKIDQILFIAGSVNSLAPCSVSIFPLIMYSLRDQSIKKMYFKWIFFTCGIYISFIIFLLINQLLFKILIASNIFVTLTAIINIIVGLLSLELLTFNISLPANLKSSKIIWISLITGISVGLTVSSCNTPILFSVLLLLNGEALLIKKFFLGFVYSLGYSIPNLVISNIFEKVVGIFNKFIYSTINSLLGVSLIAVGTYKILTILVDS
uniref:Thiol:disulfide interchange protein n=1 Tax=Bangiopsis subsimplex TaxID=139980 RepID=A0A1C9CCW5_9RHOD|nr:hypothetical protein Bangp_151 [Bangiopsis subsimplex]AOM66233.1 hypothetical protein Bangp_151 [Bangiopsis subsimplex]ARO90500.1 thiol:disulfide interchange protein [Bangiopsis subsimplex]